MTWTIYSQGYIPNSRPTLVGECIRCGETRAIDPVTQKCSQCIRSKKSLQSG